MKTTIEQIKASLEWWESLPFELKFQNMVKNKHLFDSYPDIAVSDITDEQIEKLFELEGPLF